MVEPGAEGPLGRARALIELNRLPQAEQALTEALSQQPDEPEALLLLSAVYLRTQRPSRAADALQHYLARYPDDPSALVMLSYAFAGLNRQLDAVGAATRAVQVASHDPGAHYALAAAHLAGRRPDIRAARRAAEESVRLDPFDADAHLLLGHCHDALSETTRARASYEQALRLDPLNAGATAALGALDADAGHFHQASSRLSWALATDPQARSAQGGLDEVMTRLLVLVAGGAFLALFVTGTQFTNGVGLLLRAGTGLLFVIGLVLVGARILGPLTPATRRHVGALLWRGELLARVLATTAALVSVLALVFAFAPTGTGSAREIARLAGVGLMATFVALALVEGVRVFRGDSGDPGHPDGHR